MMYYGGIELKLIWDSLVITPRKNHIDLHFEDTDMSDTIPLGRRSTLIKCTVLADGKEEYKTLQQIVHSETASDLQIDDIYYKNVTTGEEPTFRKIAPDTWYFDVTFRAGNPIPYNVASDEPLY